uniref:Uncharacterized protein n=1 Tax=Magallana gigas TaxID=29159 RepID=A0A8W8M0Q5_MAGGI|nr:uncharacterized protein LOC105341940 [Crassostrea gigas]
MYTYIAKIFIVYFVQQSGAFYLIGTYQYQNIMSFMKGEHGCRFVPWNISSNIEKENSSTGELCMVFMTPDYSLYALSQISIVHVKYESFGIESSIRIAKPPCSSDRYLQNVELILICQGKKVLGDKCQKHEQCTGTPNAGDCMADPQDNVTSSCQCNPGFMTYNGTCLQVNKTLYEECVIDDQCNGTSDKEALVCRKIRHRKLCMCNSDYIEDNTYLECHHAKRKIHEECKLSEQCTGTDYANNCFKKGKDENENGVCTCNNRYDLINGKCLKVRFNLFEPCINNKQCSGTDNAGNCTEIENNTLCYCQDEYLDFKGRCIKGNRTLNEDCEASIQCNGTKHAGVCGENHTCTCDKGFIRLEEGCLPAERHLPWISEKENQLLLLALGGGLFGLLSCSATILLFAMRRRKRSRTTRLDCRSSSRLPMRSIHYSVADNYVFENFNDSEVNIQSNFDDRTENVYDEAHQGDEDDETVNVYSVSEPQCYHREEQDSDNDTYSHLHHKPLHMSDDVYGVPSSILVPSSPKSQENTVS